MDEEYVPEHICRFHSLVLKGVFQETKECVGVTLALGKYEPIFGDLFRLVGDTSGSARPYPSKGVIGTRRTNSGDQSHP
jgi:hypothetical protein